jgi:hypothetical protein
MKILIIKSMGGTEWGKGINVKEAPLLCSWL